MKSILNLLTAWLRGRYRVVPWRTLVIFSALILYAINPLDIIPDYIPFLGYIDDAAMLGFLIRSLQKDARKFVDWEQRNESG